ncbi:MAG: hypothetical protein IPL32_14520 [Chloracidobacterium sp.]|nr:hypothetical protein [Chloracidobacterium sp.]
MARKWEKFTEPGTPKIAKLHVSMQPSGTVMLSRRAYEAIESPTHIEMLWEDETCTIGLRSVPERTLHAFRVYRMDHRGTARFHAQRFIDKHDIRVEQTVRFPTAAIEDGVLVLELAYRVPSPRRARKKK